MMDMDYRFLYIDDKIIDSVSNTINEFFNEDRLINIMVDKLNDDYNKYTDIYLVQDLDNISYNKIENSIDRYIFDVNCTLYGEINKDINNPIRLLNIKVEVVGSLFNKLSEMRSIEYRYKK